MRPALLLLALVACREPGVDVPPVLVPGSDLDVAFIWRADGMQRYGCRDGAWRSLGAQATLSDDGTPTGTHFAGPSWQALDGSSAVGREVASQVVDKTAMPWLLLKVSSHNGRPGVLANVEAIQRLETTGGLAPITACNGTTTIEVPYAASYYFFRKR